MEDAATAEISRALVWQWLHHKAPVDGQGLTPETLKTIVHEEMRRIEQELGAPRFSSGKFKEARALFEELVLADEIPDFLTLPAYDQVSAH
jgi:malate synthase